MTKHITGTRDEWLAARLELLEAEKELTRRGVALGMAFIDGTNIRAGTVKLPAAGLRWQTGTGSRAV